MRQIKASEIKPGMTIRWERLEVKTEITVREVSYFNTVLYRVHSPQGMPVFIPSDAEVTVLAEPQPEEPVTLCARIVVAGRRIYRWTEDPKEPWPWRGEALNVDPVLWSWGQLCGLGHVTVVDADPSWTAPADREPTPEVPDRIEEWPEDDTALRPYKWADCYGVRWHSERRALDTPDSWVTRLPSGRRLDFEKPTRGPWTRVTGA